VNLFKNKPACLAVFLPYFVGLYTVLNFLETNISETHPMEAMPLFLGAFFYTGIVFFVIDKFYLNLFKSALMSAIFVFFSIYWQVYFNFFDEIIGGGLSFPLFTSLFFLFFSFVSYVIFQSKFSFEIAVNFSATAFGIAFFISLSNIVFYEIERKSSESLLQNITNEEPVKLDFIGKKRNIFYIILDRYADQETLSIEYNYDNSGFIEFLRGEGFFVAEKSKANYLKTAQSLSSSLNMVYHSFTGTQIPADKSDWTPFFQLIKENRVVSILKQMGYKYIHLGSWWPATAEHPMADENYRSNFFSQFELRFLHRSIFKPLLQLFHNPESRQSVDSDQCLRVPRKFARLRELAKNSEPTFVFAHFLLPHDPFVFDETGRCRNTEELKTLSVEQGYVSQLRYANKMVKELVSEISLKSGLKPIIILQSDEGPFPTRYRLNELKFQWDEALDQELRKKMGILNAYYFPEVNSEIFYDNITPVNSFRVLFDSYFDADFPLLPDENYAFPNANNIYDFFEITETVRRVHQ